MAAQRRDSAQSISKPTGFTASVFCSLFEDRVGELFAITGQPRPGECVGEKHDSNQSNPNLSAVECGRELSSSPLGQCGSADCHTNDSRRPPFDPGREAGGRTDRRPLHAAVGAVIENLKTRNS